MSLTQTAVVRIFDKWALGIHHSPTGTVLVTGMNGEIVELDQSLNELRRWQAHEGAVGSLRVLDGKVWTGGGDALIKVWDWPSLDVAQVFEGPKKPITKFFTDGGQLIALSYDRAAFVWSLAEPDAKPRRINKVAALVRTEQGYFGCPKSGSKAGDIGPLSAFDLASGTFSARVFEDGYGAWSLQDVPGEGVLAYGLDLKAAFIDLAAKTRTALPWHSKSGGPSFYRLKDGSAFYFGDSQIYHKGTAQEGPIKGLYCAVELDDGRLALSGADGQVWVFEVD